MFIEMLAAGLAARAMFHRERFPEVVEVVPAAPPSPVPFKKGEPRSFRSYNAQQATIGLLQDAIGALDKSQLAIRPQMLAGFAGCGKTLLAKIVAATLRRRNGVTRFIEAMDVNTEEGLDAIMREVQASPGSVVFFDEIHVLAGYKHLIKLYLALDENRYHFRGDLAPVVLPPTTFLSATTDYGALPDPFKRRWVIHFLEPYTREQLQHIIVNRNIPVSRPAAELILSRTHHSGAPWECVQLLELANNARKARGARKVDTRDVERVFKLYRIDANGLRLIDRNAIEALFKLVKRKKDGEFHYAASEESVALMARIDRAEFKSSVRPRLISRGLLEIRPWWGHTLTDAAVAAYAHLRTEESTET